jgi:hypothetical protein
MGMTTPSSVLAASPKPIKGAGLTNPGIVILQFLFILLVETIEYWASKVGAFTGIAIWVAIFGGIYLGRSGTSFAAAVNPPIAFFFSTLILVGTMGGAGLHLTKFGLDMVIALGGGAPYLVIGTVIAWGWHFYLARTAKQAVNVAEIDDQKGIVKPEIEEQEIAEPEAVIDQQP